MQKIMVKTRNQDTETKVIKSTKIREVYKSHTKEKRQ